MARSKITLQKAISTDAIQILADLNPWWETGRLRKPSPHYHRRGVPQLIHRMVRGGQLIEIIRGPRQVGKTTAIEQIIERLLANGVRPTDILFVRFDQEVLRESEAGLLPIVRWFEAIIRKRRLEEGAVSYIFLDEVHKLAGWNDDIKHLGDTFPVRLMLTGSSSVLVARGTRESLAGRVITTVKCFTRSGTDRRVV